MGDGQDKVIQCAGECSDSSETFPGGVSIQVAPLTPTPCPPPPWNLEPGVLPERPVLEAVWCL